MFEKFHSHFLTKDEQKELLKYARKTIAAKLAGKMPPKIGKDSERLNMACGAFVTLRKEESLRGCIGSICSSKPVYQTVGEAAEAAAFQDPRFPPLNEKELAETIIEISILSPLRRVESIDKINVRRHGVLIRLGESQGLLLPQVAKRNKWDRQTLLENACLKATLEKDDWQKPEAEIMTFSAQVFEEQ